jgi:hypothetical protein
MVFFGYGFERNVPGFYKSYHVLRFEIVLDEYLTDTFRADLQALPHRILSE